MLVFLDTSTIKHAATTFRSVEIIFGQTRPWHLHSGSFRFTPITHHKAPAKGERLKRDIELLPELANAITTKGVDLITDDEVFYELFSQKRIGFRRDFFYGMPIKMGRPPIEYSRPLVHSRTLGNRQTNNSQINFLLSIDHPRFLAIQKATGAYQGNSIAQNELKDAFFLWCAEHNGADYFLTLDYDLARCVERCKTVKIRPKVVSPSELLGILLET